MPAVWNSKDSWYTTTIYTLISFSRRCLWRV
jgi:hypothetical protein